MKLTRRSFASALLAALPFSKQKVAQQDRENRTMQAYIAMLKQWGFVTVEELMMAQRMIFTVPPRTIGHPVEHVSLERKDIALPRST